VLYRERKLSVDELAPPPCRADAAAGSSSRKKFLIEPAAANSYAPAIEIGNGSYKSENENWKKIEKGPTLAKNKLAEGNPTRFSGLRRPPAWGNSSLEYDPTRPAGPLIAFAGPMLKCRHGCHQRSRHSWKHPAGPTVRHETRVFYCAPFHRAGSAANPKHTANGTIRPP